MTSAKQDGDGMREAGESWEPKVASLERLAEIWAEAHGVPAAHGVLVDRLLRSPLVSHIQELGEAGALQALDLARASVHGRRVLPHDWGSAALSLTVDRRLSSGASAASTLAVRSAMVGGEHARLVDAVGEFVDAAVPLVDAPMTQVREARYRILQRAATSDFHDGAFLQRRSRWGKMVPPASSSVAVIETDAVETVVLRLLALTRPRMQFAVRRGGDRVFAGHKDGYHAEGEGVPLSGLSEILDSVTLLVRQHRGAEGGRVYVQDSAVICALHHDVIGMIES